MGDIIIDDHTFVCTIQGATILKTLTHIFTYEKQVLSGGPCDKSIDDIFEITRTIVINLKNSSNIIGLDQINKILYYLSYIVPNFLLKSYYTSNI